MKKTSSHRGPDIAADYDEIAHCNRCGFCQTACPIFRSTGHEAGVARGRLALLRAIIEGRLDWNTDLEGPLFDCLLCGACTANCFPAIPTADLLVRARAQYLERVGRKPVHRLLFDHLLPYPRRLHAAARAVALGRSARLPELARALGLLRLFGRDFDQIDDILQALPAQPLRRRRPPGAYPGRNPAGPRVAYFVGCGMDVLQQPAAEATLGLLRGVARQVDVLANNCCGLPAHTYGDLPAARRLMEKNLAVMAAAPGDVIVTDCSSCAAFLKKWPALVDPGSPQAARAGAVANRVQDLVAFLDATDIDLPAHRDAAPTSYHDPCHACRGQGLVQAPRRVLGKIVGAGYRELPEADWCCGGAGSYALSHQRLSKQVLARKIGNLKRSGARVLATSCPACMAQLSYGVRSAGLTTRVVHLSELAAGAPGLISHL